MRGTILVCAVALSGCVTEGVVERDAPALDAWAETLGSRAGAGGMAAAEPATAGSAGALAEPVASPEPRQGGASGSPAVAVAEGGSGGEPVASTAGGVGGVGGMGGAAPEPFACPPGTVERYDECVSHCEASWCDGEQSIHYLEPGESLWLYRSQVGCHNVIGYRPDSPGLIQPYYGDAQRLSASGWSRGVNESHWTPDGDVSAGFCIHHLSPSDLVLAGDGCTQSGGVWCCSGQCSPS